MAALLILNNNLFLALPFIHYITITYLSDHELLLQDVSGAKWLDDWMYLNCT